jgi:hypothetical protein
VEGGSDGGLLGDVVADLTSFLYQGVVDCEIGGHGRTSLYV